MGGIHWLLAPVYEHTYLTKPPMMTWCRAPGLKESASYALFKQDIRPTHTTTCHSLYQYNHVLEYLVVMVALMKIIWTNSLTYWFILVDLRWIVKLVIASETLPYMTLHPIKHEITIIYILEVLRYHCYHIDCQSTFCPFFWNFSSRRKW